MILGSKGHTFYACMKKYEVVCGLLCLYKIIKQQYIGRKDYVAGHKAMQTGELEITNEAKDRYVKRTIEK